MKAKLTDKLVAGKAPPETGRVDVWDTIVPSLFLRIGQKRKTFMVAYRLDGRLQRHKLGVYPAMKLAEARTWARTVLEDAGAGVDPKARQEAERREAREQRRQTFENIAATFLEDYCEAKGLRTLPELRRQFDRDLTAKFGSTPIGDIERADVKEFLREKARTAPTQANRLLATLRKLYNWALDEELVQASPVARISPPGREVQRERVLTADEIKAFWKACESMGYPWGRMFQFLLVTAQRRGEVMRLPWAELDLDAGTWTMPGERVKSGKGRVVPLSSLGVDLLAPLPRLGELVFLSGRVGDKPLQGFSRAKAELDESMAEIVGHEIPNWRLHDLRRTAATNLRSLGADRLTVSKILGHAEAGVTAIYDRFSEDAAQRRALESWGGYLERLTSDDTAKVVEIGRATV